MQPDLSSPPPSGEGAERLASSARGWHSIQLAVLGFIGICGVLRTGSDSNGPQWIRWLSAALALFAFVLACLAIYQVGRVAYPFYGAPGPSSVPAGPDGLAASTRRLRTGVRMTYVAVGCLALAAVSGWWPGAAASGGGAAGALVQVGAASGESACGTLLDGGPGTLRLDTPEGTVSVRLESVLTIQPVASC
jgi:hypothetical protein